MTETRIEGKFYPLQLSEWVDVCKSLTKSQISVLYFLRSNDPYSNGIRVKASQLAKEIGITKRAVNSAIAVLEDKGYINLEDVEYSVKVNPGGCLCDNSGGVTQVGNSVPTREENFPPEKLRSHSGNSVPTREENFSPEKRISHPSPETRSGQELEISKTYKDFKDFKNSLSEDERESFIKFSRKKAASLPKPPQLPMKWIKTNFEELHFEWREAKNKKENQKIKYNFEAIGETQHQMFYGQLQVLVKGAVEFGDETSLRLFFNDDFHRCWFNWAKSARADVRELLANNPILQPYCHD